MSIVQANMIEGNIIEVAVLKSNKRRIKFLLSKIQELSSELRELEAREEELEAQKRSKVIKRSKGRPQTKKEQVEEVDLFANLVKEVVSSAFGAFECANEIESTVVSSSSDNGSIVESPVVSKKVKPVKHILTDEEKALKKAQLDAEKQEKAAAKKIQVEQDKLANAEMKKAQLEADKLAKAQERAAMATADKESKKAAIEAEKVAKKAAIEAEKEAKKQIIYEEKMFAALKKLETKQALAEAKKQEKVSAKKSKPTKAKNAVASTPAAEVVAEAVEKVTVSRITINDIKYLKSSTNILYNPDTREEVGLYDPETKMIKPLPDDDEEEMTEDAYETDDE